MTKKEIVDGTAGQRSTVNRGLWALVPALILSTLTSFGCEGADLAVPNVDQIEAAYIYPGGLSANVSGNVAEVTIIQPARGLRRGGTLWAKVGPYVLLFSEETQILFRDYPGLAGVRVITRSSDGNEVAFALLPRDELNGITWRRARNISGLARRDGTRRPSLLA